MLFEWLLSFIYAICWIIGILLTVIACIYVEDLWTNYIIPWIQKYKKTFKITWSIIWVLIMVTLIVHDCTFG